MSDNGIDYWDRYDWIGFNFFEVCDKVMVCNVVVWNYVFDFFNIGLGRWFKKSICVYIFCGSVWGMFCSVGCLDIMRDLV